MAAPTLLCCVTKELRPKTTGPKKKRQLTASQLPGGPGAWGFASLNHVSVGPFVFRVRMGGAETEAVGTGRTCGKVIASYHHSLGVQIPSAEGGEGASAFGEALGREPQKYGGSCPWQLF